MRSKILYRQEDDSLIIEIIPQPKKILEFGFWLFYVVPFCVIGFIILVEFMDNPKIDLESLMILIGSILYFLSLKVMLRKLYEKEVIEIKGGLLKISSKIFLERDRKHFQLENIRNLKFGISDKFTKHQLTTDNFDYLGFDTTEKEVHFFIESGKLNFDYLGQRINFGKNLSESNGNEILEKIKILVPTMAINNAGYCD